MGWLPDSPDELFGAIVILAVLGAVALVILGRLALWASSWSIWRRPSVNRSSSADHDYVAPSAGATPPSALFHQEREPEQEWEPEQEREQTEQAEAQMSSPNQKLYTPRRRGPARECRRQRQRGLHHRPADNLRRLATAARALPRRARRSRGAPRQDAHG